MSATEVRPCSDAWWPADFRIRPFSAIAVCRASVCYAVTNGPPTTTFGRDARLGSEQLCLTSRVPQFVDPFPYIWWDRVLPHALEQHFKCWLTKTKLFYPWKNFLAVGCK